MKKRVVSACALAATISFSANAHFQMLYTSDSQLDRPTTLDMKLVFAHPMANGHVMDMQKPQQFFVSFKGETTNLVEQITPVNWQGPSNQASAFALEYKAKRTGDYLFGMVPEPYYEEGEDIYIQQLTKRVINRGGLPTGWNEPLGLKTEIVPLNKPYQLFTGGTFTGQLLSDGQPAAGIECEVEFINTTVDSQNNAFGTQTLRDEPASSIVAVTDDNGMFTFGMPIAGHWGFACLGSGPDTEFDGKELSQDAVLWVEVNDL